MSVGFTIRFKQKKQVRKPKSIEAVMESMVEILVDNLFGPCTQAGRAEDGWLVQPLDTLEPFTIRRNGGFIEVSGSTSVLGPGWHVHVIDVLEALADQMNLTIDESSEDETGYLTCGDPAVAMEAMQGWLKAVAERVLSLPSEQYAHVAVCMDPHTLFEVPAGSLATPLGPRPVSFFERAAKDPAGCTDFWPILGDTPADLALGSALFLLWNVVPWRASITEEERETLELVLEAVHSAWKSGGTPARPFPWRAVQELAGLLKESGAEFPITDADFLRAVEEGAAAAPAEEPAIGWYRRPLRMTLPEGWSFAVPPGSTMLAGDEGYEIINSHFSIAADPFEAGSGAEAKAFLAEVMADCQKKFPGLAPQELQLGPLTVHMWSALQEESGVSLWRHLAVAAKGNAGLLLSYCNPAERGTEAARKVLGSLEHHEV